MVNYVLKSVELRLQDQFVQKWREELDSHTTCNLYKEYKVMFEMEKYLTCLSGKNIRALVKLRANNNRLPIITARYQQGNTVHPNRLCKLCTLQEVGDEYHLFFVCNNNKVKEYRDKYLVNMNYYVNNPTRAKLLILLSSDKPSIINKVSNFLKCTLPIL